MNPFSLKNGFWESQPEAQIRELRGLCDNLEARAEAAEKALLLARESLFDLGFDVSDLDKVLARVCQCIDVMSGQPGRDIDSSRCPLHGPTHRVSTATDTKGQEK